MDYRPRMDEHERRICESACPEYELKPFHLHATCNECGKSTVSGTVCWVWARAAARSHAAVERLRSGEVDSVTLETDEDAPDGPGWYAKRVDECWHIQLGHGGYSDPAEAILKACEVKHG